MTEKKTTTKKSTGIAERLLAISADAGAIAKGGKADARAGGYEYHRIDDVEEVLRPLFVKHRVLAIPTIVATETSSVQDRKGNSNFVVETTLEIAFVNADEPEDRLVVRFIGHGIDPRDKAPGKAVSYAAKTAYLSVFHLKGQPDNEADHEELAPPAATKTRESLRSKEDLEKLHNFVAGYGFSDVEILAISKSLFQKSPRELSDGEIRSLCAYAKENPNGKSGEAEEEAA